MLILFQCSTECGSGIETRRIICSHENKTHCNSELKPLEERECLGTACNKIFWFTSPWTEVNILINLKKNINEFYLKYVFSNGI